MRFIVADSNEQPLIRSFPTMVLRRDNWDDYHFKTTFNAQLHLGRGEAGRNLGTVKILKRGQDAGHTPMPQEPFLSLGDDYCSLGQDLGYYEEVSRLNRDVQRTLLRGLRDVVFSNYIRAEFQGEQGFQVSLLRSSSAAKVLDDAPLLFNFRNSTQVYSGNPLRLVFLTSVGGEDFPIDFAFSDTEHLPSRINAVIGYNGTGKTRLLANLAMVANAGPATRRQSGFRNSYGEFASSEEQPYFNSTIAISYSAFDTFDLPGEDEASEARNEREGNIFGYVYCGLRRRSNTGSVAGSAGMESLKGADEISQEYVLAVEEARSSDERRPRLLKALSFLRQEPSFSGGNLGELANASITRIRRDFANYSTGHKIVLNIVVRLAAQLQPSSLVLIDEPESHLHPPLLAALLRSISSLLYDYVSVAVIATHSPVVLQEIPRRYVRVLQRFGQRTEVRWPESETFGENVGLLTRYAFSMDSSSTDFHATLDRLAERFTLAEIEDIFGGQISSQARAYLVSVKRSGRPNA